MNEAHSDDDDHHPGGGMFAHLRNNQSENDLESNRGLLAYETQVLKKVTFGVTLLNAKHMQSKQAFLSLVQDMYNKYKEHLALIEKKKREAEEKRLKELEEERNRHKHKGKFTMVTQGKGLQNTNSKDINGKQTVK